MDLGKRAKKVMEGKEKKKKGKDSVEESKGVVG